VLWIVGHFVFDGVGRGKGSLSTDPGAVERARADVGTVDADAINIFHDGKVCCGFCMLQALIELKKVGLFSCAVIKKRRYWSAMVPGDKMTEAFDDANVGTLMAIFGVLNGVKYFLWGLKEPSYVMKMMATGGPLIANETCKDQRRRFTEGRVEVPRTFQFPLPYDWHYRFRHAVDDHNNVRHSLPLVEGTIITTQWEMRVFSFLLAVSEVNAFLTYRFFCKPDIMPTLQEFRHKIAWQLIKNGAGCG
jgi:hypothetical protein